VQDKISIGILNDYYGGILNGHQKDIMHMYFDCDMSLAEVSDELGITRQAVREVVVRSTQKLQDMEEKLQLASKVIKISRRLKQIIDTTSSEITQKELAELLSEIKEI